MTSAVAAWMPWQTCIQYIHRRYSRHPHLQVRAQTPRRSESRGAGGGKVCNRRASSIGDSLWSSICGAYRNAGDSLCTVQLVALTTRPGLPTAASVANLTVAARPARRPTTQSAVQQLKILRGYVPQPWLKRSASCGAGSMASAATSPWYFPTLPGSPPWRNCWTRKTCGPAEEALQDLGPARHICLEVGEELVLLDVSRTQPQSRHWCVVIEQRSVAMPFAHKFGPSSLSITRRRDQKGRT